MDAHPWPDRLRNQPGQVNLPDAAKIQCRGATSNALLSRKLASNAGGTSAASRIAASVRNQGDGRLARRAATSRPAPTSMTSWVVDRLAAGA